MKNKYILPLAISLVLLIDVIFLVLYAFGFRITYDPTIITNWDAVAGCAAWTGVCMSFVAILFAIWVPIKIANRQDKIALFEKRYVVYQTLYKCLIFADELDSLMETADDRYDVFCISFGLELNDDIKKKRSLILPKAHEIVTTLQQAEFLFNKIIYKEIVLLCTNLALLVGNSESQNDKILNWKNEYIKRASLIKENVVPLIQAKLSLD